MGIGVGKTGWVRLPLKLRRGGRAHVIRAIALASIPFAVGLAFVAGGAAVSADATPSPSPLSSPSPTPGPTPAAPSATLSLSTNSGPVGTPVTITGSGFPPNTDVAIYIDNPDQGYVATPARLNGGSGPQTYPGGALYTDIVVTPTFFGVHDICADTSYPGSPASRSVKACAQFAVQPQLTLSQNVGLPGTQITLTATGFPANELIAVYTDTPKDGSPADGNVAGPFFGTPGLFADGQGTLEQTVAWPGNGQFFKVNPTTAGPHTICADTGYPGSTGPDKVKACAQFLVQAPPAVPTLLLHPISGGVGTRLLIEGAGFAGQTQLYVTIDGKTVVSDACTTHATGSSGSFQLELVMQLKTSYQGCPPASISYGKHTICVDAMSHVCADFVLLGSQPAAATGSILGVSRTLAAAAGLVVLLLLAAGGAFLARRAAKPRSIPPIG